MFTTWDTTEPQQSDNLWIGTGIMADEAGNQFRIMVTTPILPEANVLALKNFMKLQTMERYQKVDILFEEEATRAAASAGNELPVDLHLENLSLTLIPIQLVTTHVYFLKIADTIEDELAGPGTYPFAITTTDFFARCDVKKGEVEMSVTNGLGTFTQATTILGGQSAQINPDRTDMPINWQVTLYLKGDKNLLSYTIKGIGKQWIQ